MWISPVLLPWKEPGWTNLGFVGSSPPRDGASWGTPKRSVGIGPRNEKKPFLQWKNTSFLGRLVNFKFMNFMMFPSKITNLLSCTTHFGWSNMKTNCWNLKYHFLGETYPKRIPIMCHVCHRISTSGSSWGYGFMCSPVETNPQKLRIVRI